MSQEKPRRTPRDALAEWFLDRGFDKDAEELADEVLSVIKRAGFSILQRV